MPPAQKVVIRFVVECPTRYGQHLLIVGSCSDLGAWTVGHRLQYVQRKKKNKTPKQNQNLFADFCDFGRYVDGKWVHEITLPQDSNKKFSYKYLLTEGLNASWEEGPNREFELAQEIEGAIEIRDTWRFSTFLSRGENFFERNFFTKQKKKKKKNRKKKTGKKTKKSTKKNFPVQKKLRKEERKFVQENPNFF